MRILLATFSAEGHGSYGIITRELWKRLLALNPDWNVVQHGWLHQSVEPVPWHVEPTARVMDDSGKVGPHKGDVYGKITFPKMVEKFKPDVVWTVSDPYMSDYMVEARKKYGFKLVRYHPVDGVPQPPVWANTIKECDLLVPMTEFGANAIKRQIGGEKLSHIYHGVDVSRFTPMPESKREAIRPKHLGEDSIILGYVGHCQFRKMNWTLYPIVRYLSQGAWARCNDCLNITLADWDPLYADIVHPKVTYCRYCGGDDLTHGKPHNAHLWMHTFERANVFWVPEKLRDYWGIQKRVHFTSEMSDSHGIPDAEMPLVYNSFDIHMCLSGGEGFGIPVIEAMACGVPTVYTPYSGHGEIAVHCGLPVKLDGYIPDNLEPIQRSVANIADTVGVLDRLITDKKLYKKLAAHGPVKARELFDWDRIANQWDTLLRSNFSKPKGKVFGVKV
jgi:glycosyltransferase involved in cell wall biosynthesis